MASGVRADRVPAALVVALLCVMPCGRAAAVQPAGTGDWLFYGQSPSEQRFCKLAQIDTRTVSGLGLAWSIDLPGEHALEATPLEVGGTLYFTGQDSSVYAVDARLGKLLWKYDPESYRHRPRHVRYIFAVNRGAAYWRGRIYVGTLDGRLIALEARTGRVKWSVETVAADSAQTITGAPRVFNGKVVIGNGGADWGARGYVTAYDAETGTQVWRFYTVPGDPAQGFEQPALAMAAKTWSGEWWKRGGGGTAWDGLTYDREFNRLYIGVGNSFPYNPRLRSPAGGDNLFLASIVAVDADTGRYVWHYQVNPNEAWDFKATAQMTLAELKIAGVRRKVLMQAPTNGFFYVLDRRNGKLISAQKIGKVTWAERIDLQTGRPVEAPNIRYENGPVTIWPSGVGAHSWQAMSFSPTTGLVYIPYMHLGLRYFETPEALVAARQSTEVLLGGGATLAEVVVNDPHDATGSLIAWDPVAQQPRWKVQYPSIWNGGTLVTGGNLVFQGDADGIVHAYEASTGKELWKFFAGLGIVAPPISYSIRGEQYVSILVGYGGATATNERYNRGWKYGAQMRRLLTFALGAHATLPPTAPPDFALHPAQDDLALVLDPGEVAAGEIRYQKSCALCHGYDLKSTGVPGPDLRESALAANADSLSALLRTGSLERNGMPRFDDLSAREVHSLFLYIRAGLRKAAGEHGPAEPAAQNTGVAR
jgi:quinohemoprotein ethanol dehydrogenase